jgi:hypothetical protein
MKPTGKQLRAAAAKRQRDLKARRAEAGIIPIKEWVRRADVPRMREFARQLRSVVEPVEDLMEQSP